jgi:hypothetical protein
MFYIESLWVHQNTWKPTVCCLFSGSGINSFRMASSNSSPAEKSCACAYIAFLAGIFTCYADSSNSNALSADVLITTFGYQQLFFCSDIGSVINGQNSEVSGLRDGIRSITLCSAPRKWIKYHIQGLHLWPGAWSLGVDAVFFYHVLRFYQTLNPVDKTWYFSMASIVNTSQTGAWGSHSSRNMDCNLMGCVCKTTGGHNPTDYQPLLWAAFITSNSVLSRSRLCHYSVGDAWWHLCFYESF